MRTSSWNVCTRPASPLVLAPNDYLGVQALSLAREDSEEGTSGSRDPEEQTQTSVSTSKDPLTAGSSTSIPWTIANKYYTAEVHFETHDFEGFRVHHAIGVPAIIYVWGPGEVSLCGPDVLARTSFELHGRSNARASRTQPYREHVPEIAQKIQHYDPEVSLAVRFGGNVEVASPAEPNVDDDGLDEFLSTHGFEFVEGDRSYRRPTQDTERHSDDEDSGTRALQ